MRTAIKICGVRDPKMAKQAIELGADYVGIICYEQSKRYVQPQDRKAIVDAVKAVGGTLVLIFVDSNSSEMLSICEELDVNVVQLSGTISRQTHHELPEDIQRIYVLHVDEGGVIQPDIDQGLSKLMFTRYCVMYDGLHVGSGCSFRLDEFSNPSPMPFFLAGGLTSENIGNAINTVHPDVVDVSSGVESSPGVKDIKKIKAFIEAVRSTE